jgi:primosomal protein N' (replication factor Y)
MRVVRVLPDVSGLDREFTYVVGDPLDALVEMGDRVRVPLHGRVVAGWVTGFDPDDDGTIGTDSQVLEGLKQVRSRSGVGPGVDLVELTSWAAWRWAGRRRAFLGAASPAVVVPAVPGQRFTTSRPEPRSPATSELLRGGGGVLRLPPCDDVMAALASALEIGPVLVVTPSIREAVLLAGRLRRARCSVALMPDDWAAARGGVDVVIGPRGAAWAPCPQMASAVVLDEHDEALQSEASPTWHARDVLAERCRRRGVPLILISPNPTPEALQGRTLASPPADREARSWPALRIVDRGADEHRVSNSLVSTALIEHLRTPGRRVLCVLNTKGRSRLSACRSCRELARCERCEAAVGIDDRSMMVCPHCATERPGVCAACGSTAFALLRPGVSRLREELEAAAARPVGHVTAQAGASDDTAEIQIGTEALLYRSSSADVVAFLDFDQELVAPRFRAAEHAMALIIRAGRLVGPRHLGGEVLVQTHLVDHEVLVAAASGDPGRLAAHTAQRRQSLHLPPFSALAEISGTGMEEFVASLVLADGVTASVGTDRTLLRAPSTQMLCDTLATGVRPPRSRLRIAVDPPRL